MTDDKELIARLRLYGSKFHHEFGHNDAADRIEALIEESARRLALIRIEGVARVDQCERAEALEAKLTKAVEALESLIQQTHDCEKELTEDLHHVDFCGESEPLTKARATLAEIKGESHD